MSMWTKEKTLNLIDKIRSSGVWDIKSKDTNRRNDILEDIANSLTCSKKDDKWHNIKSQFSREQSKINASKKSGCGTDEVYTLSWYAFQRLNFLGDQYKPHKNRSTDENITQTTVVNDEHCIDEAIEITELDRIDKDEPEMLMQDNDGNKGLTPQQSRKRKSTDNISDMESVVKTMKIVGDGMAQRQRKDEFTVYGENVANELTKFKGEIYDLILAEAKHKISTALFEADLQRIRIAETSAYTKTVMSSLSFDDMSNSSSPIIIATHYSNSSTSAEPNQKNYDY